MNDILKSLGPFAANPREATIPSPHDNTFEWIWTEKKHNFVTWLEQGHGLYLITGRQGSGKSTLMKFIIKNERTRKHLAKEDDGSIHKLFYYYFYDMSELPTHQERNIDGLLHYILYQLLDSFPELATTISGIFAQEEMLPRRKTSGRLASPWSLQHLKDALIEISKQDYVHGKICLFIDGFDECQGDALQNLDFVLSWLEKMQGSGLKVKICMASRYIEDLMENLRPSLQRTTLKLHEWTRDDIQKYVQDSLGDATGRSISLSTKSHKIIGNRLISDIVKNAEGVFIWVKLVVADLKLSLGECQEESQLQSRLQALPPGLENLYNYIINEIPKRDLHAVFKYFYLLLRAPGDRCTLTLLQFLVAAQRPDEAITCDLEYRSEADSDHFLSQKLDIMRNHLKRRCRNLIQIRSRKNASSRWDPLRRENVTFIHVTLKEFLKKSLQTIIANSGIEMTVSADTLLMASYLRLLKCQISHIPYWAAYKPSRPKEICGLENETASEKNQSSRRLAYRPFFDDYDEGDEAEYEEEINRRTPDNCITKFFNYAHNLETQFHKPQTQYIDELDRVLKIADPDWASKFYSNKTFHHVNGVDIFCLAVCWKLRLYLKQKLTSQLVNKKRQLPLLFYAMNPRGWAHEPVDLKIFELLLKKKPRLNEVYVDNGKEQTIWGHAFQHYLCIGTNHPEEHWEHVLKLMLKYGADANQKISLQDADYTTALHLLVKQYEKVSSKNDKQAVEQAIELLMRNGADVERENSDGITAYEYAQNSARDLFGDLSKAVGRSICDRHITTPSMVARISEAMMLKSRKEACIGKLPIYSTPSQSISMNVSESPSSRTQPVTLSQQNLNKQPQEEQASSSRLLLTEQVKRGHHRVTSNQLKRHHSETELDDTEGQ